MLQSLKIALKSVLDSQCFGRPSPDLRGETREVKKQAAEVADLTRARPQLPSILADAAEHRHDKSRRTLKR